LPLSIDDIRAGRRRDWDKLKDPEVRKAEERARAEELAKARTRALNRDELRREEQESAVREWIRTRRQLIGLAIVLLSAVVLFAGFRALVWWKHESAFRSSYAELAALYDAGTRIDRSSTPLEAFMSWRSAWQAKDGLALYDMYSTEKRRTMRGRRNEAAQRLSFAHQVTSGAQDAMRSIPQRFGKPERVLHPTSGWRQGTLAVFRSEPLRREAVQEPPAQWVAIFVYEAADKKWRFVEFRPAKTWKEKWTREAMIQPVVAGVNRSTLGDM
jgi:ABC-type multidrug transport system fused ATPase/permease subunit